jgi:hypothetical protein
MPGRLDQLKFLSARKRTQIDAGQDDHVNETRATRTQDLRVGSFGSARNIDGEKKLKKHETRTNE